MWITTNIYPKKGFIVIPVIAPKCHAPFQNRFSMKLGYLYTHLQCKNMYKCTIKICQQKRYRAPLSMRTHTITRWQLQG
jgi:hypothetical protein